MAPINRVIAVDREPNEDGDNVIEVILGDGSRFDASIDLGAAQKLVEILQQRLVRWASESAKNLRFPQLEVIDTGVSHAGQEAQLMVSTTQMGWLVLQMTEEVLQKAKDDLDRVLPWRGSPSIIRQ
jgi:hypothetical protein